MPNSFAYLALILWPITAFILSRKLRIQDAAIVLFLAPYLFLPERTGWDLPGIPPLQKSTIPALTAILVFSWCYKRKGMLQIPNDGLVRIFAVLLFLGPIFTFLSNMESFNFGVRHLRGLGLNDLVSMEFNAFCILFIPFVIGWKLLSSVSGHRTILKYIVVFGLGYSLLMLWEVRMSPQLHNQIYGFFPHSFSQQIRQGGFRPVVFLGHGLLVAIFCAFTLLSVAILYKAKDKALKGRGWILLIYLSVVLVLCKTIGAIILSVIVVPIILFCGPSRQLQLASFLAVIVLLYPMLRSQNLVPVQHIITYVNKYSEERAESFQFRVENEDMLLGRASERVFFGWGGWGRNRIYDPKTGADLSVTDGFWIIIMGVSGWLGYLSVFGLLTYPIIRLHRLMKKNKIKPSIYTSGVALVLALNLIDLLPNASFNVLTMLLAGSLFGAKEQFLCKEGDQWAEEKSK